MMRAAWLVALLELAACRSEAPRPPLPAQGRSSVIRSCEYTVRLATTGAARVRARCAADGTVTFRVSEDKLIAFIDVNQADRLRAGDDGVWRAQPVLASTTNGGFSSGAHSEHELEYRVDVAGLAARQRHFDSAAKVGESFVAPMYSLLLVPEPISADIPVRVRLETELGIEAVTGLRRGNEPDSYELMAHEIAVATYLSFGKLERRTLRFGEGELEIAKLDGKLDHSLDDYARWVEISARAVRNFYGVFPVTRASVTLLPRRGRDGVLFGKVLPESAPGIVIVLGERASERELYGDWILIHELFHLGFPSFYREGKWLDEGTATYYEPIIRVRAGLLSEHDMWRDFARDIWQGVPAFTEYGLENASDFRGVYWGGALAVFAADVEARRRGSPERGLEVGLRALHRAGGKAHEVWSLNQAISEIDRALEAPILTHIASRHARRGSPFDLAALLRDLGVIPQKRGRILLSDSAPLAPIRKAIASRERAP